MLHSKRCVVLRYNYYCICVFFYGVKYVNIYIRFKVGIFHFRRAFYSIAHTNTAAE